MMQSDLVFATGYVAAPTRPVALPPPIQPPATAPDPAALSLPARCFGAQRNVPEWLLQPWLTLQSAAQRRRPMGARLADLTQVGRELDELFAVHLPRERAWLEENDGTSTSRIDRVVRWVDGVIGEAEALFQHQIRPDLALLGIAIKPVVQLDEWQRAWLHQYFMQRVYPILTPLAVDPGRPFPFISSDSLNLLVELRKPERASSQQRAHLFARVKVPRATPRLVPVPATPLRAGGVSSDRPAAYVCSADLVRFFVHHLFPGMPVRHVYFFRLIRGDQPLPGGMRAPAARQRRQEDKPVARLEVERRIAPMVLDWLVDHLALPNYAVARHDRLFDWSCLPTLAETVQAMHAAEA